MKAFQILKAVSIATALGVFLAGCSSGSEDGSSTASPAADTGSVATTSSGISSVSGTTGTIGSSVTTTDPQTQAQLNNIQSLAQRSVNNSGTAKTFAILGVAGLSAIIVAMLAERINNAVRAGKQGGIGDAFKTLALNDTVPLNADETVRYLKNDPQFTAQIANAVGDAAADKVGDSLDEHNKPIVEAVNKHGEATDKHIADLNTHLGNQDKTQGAILGGVDAANGSLDPLKTAAAINLITDLDTNAQVKRQGVDLAGVGQSAEQTRVAVVNRASPESIIAGNLVVNQVRYDAIQKDTALSEDQKAAALKQIRDANESYRAALAQRQQSLSDQSKSKKDDPNFQNKLTLVNGLLNEINGMADPAATSAKKKDVPGEDAATDKSKPGNARTIPTGANINLQKDDKGNVINVPPPIGESYP